MTILFPEIVKSSVSLRTTPKPKTGSAQTTVQWKEKQDISHTFFFFFLQFAFLYWVVKSRDTESNGEVYDMQQRDNPKCISF